MTTTNKILLGCTCLVVGLYLSLDNQQDNLQTETFEVKNTIEEKEKPIVKKEIEIVYLEDETKNTQEKKNDVYSKKVFLKEDLDNKQEYDNSNIDSDNDYTTEELQDLGNIKEPTKYIENRGLVNINLSAASKRIENSEIPRYGIYADIDMDTARANRDEFVPPSLPVVINSTFSSGEPYSVVIDHDVYSQAQEIIVSDNNPDGTINQIVRIPTKNSQNGIDSQIIAPPSIGY